MPGIARAALKPAPRSPRPQGGSASRRGAAPTMPGCPRLALVCALPWLLRAAAPASPAQPLAQRRDPRDPARGADFDHVYSGVVNLSTENIYSFSYTSHPGQVRHSLPWLGSQELARSHSPVAALGPLGIDLRRPQDWGPLALFLVQSNHCPAGTAASSATGPGNNSASFRASPGLVPGISGFPRHWFPAWSAGPVNLVGLSLGKS